MSHEFLIKAPFAHRGLHGAATGHVENSLSAFQAANARGHGVELDVLLSHDGKAMVFHDLSLKRLTGYRGCIGDFTAEQLSKFTLTTSEDVILTLGNILHNLNPDFPVLIEIKGDQHKPEQIAKAVFEDIRDYPGPVAVMSFYPDIILWFLENAPEITRGLVATNINDGDLPDPYFSVAAQKSYIDDLDVDFIAYDIKALPNEVTEYCRSRNIPVLTWTVRTEELQQKARQYTDNSIYENLDL
ncbi:MAG: glycerophosphodiester phosphodiesterase [Alphaproteobacteria bacterium]|nr:MAG: glycerophosphodiester phosphodiesterase [Alphaproteobacteria bacterium]